MKTVIQMLVFVAWYGWIVGLCVPSRAFPLIPPPEALAGLTPGENTVADASRLYGTYDTALSGDYSPYAGGAYGVNAYRWTGGVHGKVPGLIVETSFNSPVIDFVIVDQYPGLATCRGLMAISPEDRVGQLYGFPDYAYELTFVDYTPSYRELFYIEQGLLVVLTQVNGRPNWTVSRLVLTYPAHLRTAVSRRNQYAANGVIVEDITDIYRVWMQMLSSPAMVPAD